MSNPISLRILLVSLAISLSALGCTDDPEDGLIDSGVDASAADAADDDAGN